MGSRLIISYFIVGLLGLYGMLFSPDLGFVGLCLALLEIYMPAGGRVAVRGVRLFGKWFSYALCGVSGGSVMIGALRTSRGLRRNLFTCSSLRSIHGLRGGWPSVCLVFLIFFLFSPLPLNPFVYSQCTKGCVSLRFCLILLTFQKKKKKRKFFLLSGHFE